MVRSTISITLLLSQLVATGAFTVSPAANTRGSNNPLFSFAAFHYEEPDAIMMEQNGGVVPARPVKPIKTHPSSISKIHRSELPSDDQHDLNHHDVSTVPSAMSAIERGRSASDDQHDSNYHGVRTVPSAMSSGGDNAIAKFKTVPALPSNNNDRSSDKIEPVTPKFRTITAVPLSKKRQAANPYYE